ncbi:MAG: hypothetical protein ACRCZB_05650 [Bacteroidales bacterium]
MKLKLYLIRATKYVAYFYLLCVLLYALVLFFGTQEVSQITVSQLISPRLMIGLTLLGLLYPFFGFNCSQIAIPEGGWDRHGKNLYEVMALCGFRILKKEKNAVVFCATNTFRRLLSLYEESVTLEITDNILQVTGMRKDVARIKLRINDYIRNT